MSQLLLSSSELLCSFSWAFITLMCSQELGMEIQTRLIAVDFVDILFQCSYADLYRIIFRLAIYGNYMKYISLFGDI